MSKHEMFIINDFKIIFNHNNKSKTTMVESYISSGCINETKENANYFSFIGTCCYRRVG